MCRCSGKVWIVIFGAISIGVGYWMRATTTGPVCTSKADLSGKTVIVTGGNVGIGLETAIGLAKHNARVIIACRNTEKAARAVQEIKKASGKSSVEYMNLDLADMDNIRRFAKEFTKKEERLDILVNNAGTVNVGKTKDGFDMMFGVNHLGPFLLTNLLLPLMRKTSKESPVRIINLSSAAYKAGEINFDNISPDLDDSTTMAGSLYQYANTKLMNIYFTSELDKRLKDEFKGKKQVITTYSLHPGSIRSDLGREMAEYRGGITQIVRDTWIALFMKPVFYGAQTTLCCAFEEKIEEHSGGYFSDVKPSVLWNHATDPEVGKKLWELSEKYTGLSRE